MKEETCIICGRPFPTGLHIWGCLICFPCEKQLLTPGAPRQPYKRLCRLYDRSGVSYSSSC